VILHYYSSNFRHSVLSVDVDVYVCDGLGTGMSLKLMIPLKLREIAGCFLLEVHRKVPKVGDPMAL